MAQTLPFSRSGPKKLKQIQGFVKDYKISGNKIERVGKYTEWYYGRIKEEGNYKNDLKDGKWTSWEDNRDGDWIKQSEGTYKNGEENGKWTSWHSNGKKLKE